MPETIFVDGLIAKEFTFPDGGTIQKLSFKVEEMIQFLQQHNNDGWCNAIIAKSQKSGKLYAKLDEWKPNTQQGGQQSPQQDYNQDNSYKGEFNQDQRQPQPQNNQPQPQNNQPQNTGIQPQDHRFPPMAESELDPNGSLNF